MLKLKAFAYCKPTLKLEIEQKIRLPKLDAFYLMWGLKKRIYQPRPVDGL